MEAMESQLNRMCNAFGKNFAGSDKGGTWLSKGQILMAELATDAGTQRTLNVELITDHAAFKTVVDELVADHATIKTVIDEIDADHDVMNNIHDHALQDGVIGGNFGITAGAAVTLTGAGFVEFLVNGQRYYGDLDTTIALTDDGDVDNTKFRAWRIEIDRGLVVTATADGDTQHATEEDAIMALSAVAPTANTATLGYFTIQSDTGFAVGAVNVNGETAEAVYIIRGPKNQVSGLNAALGSAIVADVGAATWSSGTINVNRNGAKLAQIAAVVNQAMDDADTIATLKAGGWLLCVDLAGTGVYALAADGVPGSVSAMAYDSTALVDTALGLLVTQLPEMLVPIGKIVVDNQSGGTFTAGTTFWDAASITTVATDVTLGTWDRTASGLDEHQINPPTVPASLTAASPATLSAAAPATLAAGAPGALTASTPGSIA